VIDFGAQPKVKRATARLKAGRYWGTGYLIESARVATCFHVVKGLPAGATVTCAFGEETREATVLTADEAADIAILALALPVTAEPLEILDGDPLLTFWIYGFPAFTNGTGTSIEARLNDPNTVNAEKVRAFAMYSDQFTARTTESLGGLSGSPVLAGGKVIGHVTSVLGSSEAAKAPHLGLAYAIRGSGVRALLGSGVVTNPPMAPARAITVESRARVFDEIAAATTAADVHAALAAAHGKTLTNDVKQFAATHLIGLGLPTAAIKLLETIPETNDSRSELAVAYSLIGNHARAQALVGPLITSRSRAVEGGVLKRRWIATQKPVWLHAAYDAYAAGYALDHDHYPGINAAFCLLALRRPEESKQLARELIGALEPLDSRDGWQEASLAEACLLIEDLDKARSHYAAAAKTHRPSSRNLALMRRQARTALELLGRPRNALDDVFAVPKAAAFTGHQVDRDEKRGRFPPSREAFVAKQLAATLAECDVQFGYSSAADGGDILFIEAVLARGGEPHVYLPFPADKFMTTSVTATWRPRFKKLIEQLADRVVVLSDRMPDDEDARNAAYARCNEVVQDATRAQAAMLDEPPLLVAVVAHAGEASIGGTADALSQWKARGGSVVEIDPSVAAA
jgi:hypothetical protein